MGNVCCGAGNSEMLQRQELLKEGSEFKKKTTHLGVLSKTEHIYLQLNPTATRLLWRLTTGSSRAEEIPIHRIGEVCPSGKMLFMTELGLCWIDLRWLCGSSLVGALEMVIFGSNGQKLLELTADAMSVRDLWVTEQAGSFVHTPVLAADCVDAHLQVQTLDELCFSTQSKATKEDSKALQQELAKQEQRQKGKYWKDRVSELEQRKMDAEERKKKIGLSGMKYTAQAMANR